LTAAEIAALPDLIIIRILTNVVYFAGRYVAGEDSLAPLTGRADVYAQRCAWVRQQADWLRALATRHLTAV
jgi:homoserine kinase type II